MPALDLATWTRRELYAFYLGFEDPWFNLTAEVDARATRAWCDATGHRFALAVWWAVLGAASEVAPLRQRLRPGGVWEHGAVRLGVTTPTAGAFTFAYLPPADDFAAFHDAAEAEQARRSAGPLQPTDAGPDDLIYGTVVPWIRFTSIKHARQGGPDPGIPRVAVGRATPDGARLALPVNVEAHHALVDGAHVGAFFAALQRRLDAPGTRR